MMTDMTLKQYKTPVIKRIGGVFLFLIGVLFLAATFYYAVQDIPLWVFGRQAKAEVVELWVEQLNQLEERENGELQFSYNLKYQFTTPSGRVVKKNATAGPTEWSSMWEGQQIDIVYFPLYPNLNRLDDSRWTFFLSCTYIPLIIIGLIGLRVGWYMLTSP
jgi:hypothetical protein